MKFNKKTISKWLVPPNIEENLVYIAKDIYYNYKNPERATILKKNIALKNTHQNKRCFILGCAPSINNINLSQLANEHCICLNQFYLHDDYNKLLKKHHLQSALFHHNHIPENIIIKYFQDFDKLENVQFLLDYNDRNILIKNNLLTQKQINYFLFIKDPRKMNKEHIDATKYLYRSRNVSLMAIQIAIYMGFKEIYLVGVAYSSILKYAIEFLKNNYKEHINNINLEKLSDSFPYHCINSEKNILLSNAPKEFWDRCDWGDISSSFNETWNQYMILYKYALSQNIKIINTSQESTLTMFPKIDLKSVLENT